MTARRARRLLAVAAVFACLAPASCSTNAGVAPSCDPSDRLVVLVAQSVPSATLVPCVRAIPTGWTFGGSVVSQDSTTMWLSSVVAGVHSVELTLTATCNPGDAVEVVPAADEAGARVYEGPQALDPFQGSRYVTFLGGCVVVAYRFVPGVPPSLSLVANDAFSFVNRVDVVSSVRDELGETLCGAGAPPCLSS
jgi:hypothetical protein